MDIMQWIKTVIKVKALFVPFSSMNILYRTKSGGEVGYKDYYIFGIRIARLQKTEPWE